MGDQSGESGGSDPVDQLVCSKRSFSSRTPNVDPFGIQNEYPQMESGKMAAELIKGQFVVCRDKNRRGLVRSVKGIESGGDPVIVAFVCPTHAEVSHPLAEGDDLVSNHWGVGGVERLPSGDDAEVVSGRRSRRLL